QVGGLRGATLTDGTNEVKFIYPHGKLLHNLKLARPLDSITDTIQVAFFCLAYLEDSITRKDSQEERILLAGQFASYLIDNTQIPAGTTPQEFALDLINNLKYLNTPSGIKDVMKQFEPVRDNIPASQQIQLQILYASFYRALTSPNIYETK